MLRQNYNLVQVLRLHIQSYYGRFYIQYYHELCFTYKSYYNLSCTYNCNYDLCCTYNFIIKIPNVNRLYHDLL